MGGVIVKRHKGDAYSPIVKVLKDKKGIPTKIHASGREYALIHNDYVDGNKNKINREVK